MGRLGGYEVEQVSRRHPKSQDDLDSYEAIERNLGDGLLKVKKFVEDAKLPVSANPGQDLGYDLFAAEDAILYPGITVAVDTGIGVEFTWGHGAIIKDRSSMALKGIKTSAGVLDAGYRGRIKILLTLDTNKLYYSTDGTFIGVVANHPMKISKGDKIAQMVPVQPLTSFDVKEVVELTESSRGEKGFGSSGK